ncbi:MAG: response regulator transcription factor [Candidatus Hodarchaeales archaeon]
MKLQNYLRKYASCDSMVRIFIIDDDKDIVFLFRQLLNLSGHEVVATAYNGDQAIKIFKELQSKEKKPDVILLDYRMPFKNGIEVTKELLTINPGCKILIISADTSIKDSAIEAGAFSFLEKPTDFNQLNNEIIHLGSI